MEEKQYEVELKFRLEDQDLFIQTVQSLGTEFGAPIQQIDRYFAHPQRNFAKTDEALRLRSVGDHNVVTYKGPKLDAETKTRHEIEFSYSEGEAGRQQFANLLEALGFRSVASVTKSRRKTEVAWEGQQFEIVIDQVQEVGLYAEIETTANAATLDAARDRLKSLAEHLGLTQQERRGYLDMLLELIDDSCHNQVVDTDSTASASNSV